jgi:hypothetical protein
MNSERLSIEETPRNAPEARDFTDARAESHVQAATGQAEREASEATGSISLAGGTPDDVAHARQAGERYRSGVEKAVGALEEELGALPGAEGAVSPVREAAAAVESAAPAVTLEEERFRRTVTELLSDLDFATTTEELEEVFLRIERLCDTAHAWVESKPRADAAPRFIDDAHWLLDRGIAKYRALERAAEDGAPTAESTSVLEDLAAYGIHENPIDLDPAEFNTILHSRLESMSGALLHFGDHSLRNQELLLKTFGDTTGPYLFTAIQKGGPEAELLAKHVAEAWAALQLEYRNSQQRFIDTIERTGMTREEYQRRFVEGGETVSEFLASGTSGAERALRKLVQDHGPTELDSDLSVDEFLKLYTPNQ